MNSNWTIFRATVSKRIDEGMKYLDVHHPNWHDRVDLRVLDEGDLRKSVYAQVTGEIFTETDLGKRPWKAEDLGMFLRPTQCPDHMLGMGYQILTELWKKKINALRAMLVA